MHWSLTIKTAAILLALVCITGCNQNTRQVTISRVEGTVTLDGTPLQDGVVSMECAANGFAASAALDAEGHFVIEKIPTGSYRISVNPPELPPPGETPPPRPATMGPIRKIPANYHVLNTSGLTADVPAEGLSDLVLELE